MRKTVLLLCAVMLTAATAAAERVRVDTQQEFDLLAKDIEAAVKGGARIVEVEIGQGTFYFRNRHIALSRKQWEEVALIIRGDNTIIEPADEALRDTVPPAPLKQTDRLIEVADESQKLCRLHLEDPRPLTDRGQEPTHITITQWFKSLTYKVERISGGWVYFKADDLSYNTYYKCHNINLDYGYSLKKDGKGIMPRYRMESAAANSGTACRLLSMDNCTFASVEISSITFRGNKDSASDYLIYINNSHADSIAFKECDFLGIRSGVILAQGSSNVRVSACRFRACHRAGILANYCEATVVSDNSFDNMGLACNNNYCIRVSGKDYYVARNRITDFGYGGIAAGTWWKTEKRTVERGVVEYNTLSYSAPYFQNIAERGLMDSGAIYLYTQNDDVKVRYNFIHDYTGLCDNRGIFCDDGACHFELYGNIILNTPNGYSIDSRYTPSIAKDPQSKTRTINTGNRIYDNIIDGNLRFEGTPAGSESVSPSGGCSLGNNIVLTLGSKHPAANVLNNLSRQRAFISAPYIGIDKGKVVVPAATMRRISDLDSAKPMLEHFQMR